MKLLTPIAIITIATALYFMYISPKVGEVKALMMTKDKYSDTLDKTKELVALKESVSAEYNSISEGEIDKLNRIIPKDFNAITFANDMSSMALKHGMAINDFKSSTETSGGETGVVLSSASSNYKTNVVSFKVSGTYDKFLSFLGDIEKNLQLSDVTVMLVTTKDKKINQPILDFSLELNTYSLQ